MRRLLTVSDGGEEGLDTLGRVSCKRNVLTKLSYATYATRVYEMSSSGCLLCFIFEQPNRCTRLYSPSNSQVLAVLTSLASDVLSEVLSAESRSSTSPVYLCRKCFTTVEKVYKTRNELAKLEDDVVKRIDHAAADRRQ